MTTSSVSSIAGVSASTSATQSKLVELPNGEYTAASVSSDQTDANKLGLQKEKDGNYGTTNPSVANSAPAQQLSSGVQSALLSQTLGGN